MLAQLTQTGLTGSFDEGEEFPLATTRRRS